MQNQTVLFLTADTTSPTNFIVTLRNYRHTNCNHLSHRLLLKLHVECKFNTLKLDIPTHDQKLHIYKKSSHIIDIPLTIVDGRRDFSGTNGILEYISEQPTLKAILYPDCTVDVIPSVWTIQSGQDFHVKLDLSKFFAADISNSYQISKILFETTIDSCSNIFTLLE